MSLVELTPEEVFAKLKAGEILLVDVREPHEFALERIHGALLHPLSTFEPAAMPVGGPRAVVVHCARGGRSSKAVELCQAAGVPIDTHMSGGMIGWKEAGLPYARTDPATGELIDSGKPA